MPSQMLCLVYPRSKKNVAKILPAPSRNNILNTSKDSPNKQTFSTLYTLQQPCWQSYMASRSLLTSPQQSVAIQSLKWVHKVRILNLWAVPFIKKIFLNLIGKLSTLQNSNCKTFLVNSPILRTRLLSETMNISVQKWQVKPRFWMLHRFKSNCIHLYKWKKPPTQIFSPCW
jgi:hypothetical protein